MNEPLLHKPAATLRDVARTLGISHMTVSRALRHSPKVKEMLRLKIEQTAVELGYRPNPAAAALNYYRSSSRVAPVQAVLAWLNFWPDPKKMRMVPLFAENWRGVVEAAEVLGYKVEEFACGNALQPAKLQRVLDARGIQGILLPPQRPPIHREDFDFDWEGYAAIRIGHSVPYPAVNMVSYSQVSDMLDALDLIRERGYRRIGFVTSATVRDYSLFDAGYLKAQSLRPDDALPILCLEDSPQPVPAVAKRLSNWIDKYKPDAILSTENNIAALLSAAGRRIPEDIAVAATSLDNCTGVDAGMRENPAEVGRVAIRNLVALLHRNELGIPSCRQDILVRSVWQDGATLPPRG